MTGPLSDAMTRKSIVREALKVAQDSCGKNWIGKQEPQENLKALLHIGDGTLLGGGTDASRAQRLYKAAFTTMLIAGIWTFLVVVGDTVEPLIGTDSEWTGFNVTL